MAGVIAHAGDPFDHTRDAGQGPELRVKAMRSGALTQGGLDSKQARLIEPRFASRPPCAPQCGHTAPPPLPVPPAHTLTADLEGPCHSGHDLSGGEQPGGPLASKFQSVKVSARSGTRMRAHSPIIDGKRSAVAILCEAH
jgi:hypothetical protein